MKKVYIDKLGRIVIPKGIREELSLSDDVPLYISREGKSILITPLECVCALCGRIIKNNVTIPLCEECISEVKKQ